MQSHEAEIAIVGAGFAGLATAYYLSVEHGKRDLLLLDPNPPMSFTSAKSGENYRNWWPHRVMTAFTDRSIDMLERLERDSGGRLQMTRRGYLLCTRRADADALIRQLYEGYGAGAERSIRLHEGATSASYAAPDAAGWEGAPQGVDVLRNRALIHASFPSLADDIATALHIRRAGHISGQQMGQVMLERIRGRGGRVLPVRLRAVEGRGPFVLDVAGTAGNVRVRADVLVNAAGPFAGEVAAMLGQSLPVTNVLQQKLAFADVEGAIPRRMPFVVDLDGQSIDWSEDERELLAHDAATAWLTAPMPGGIHCRPEGGDGGSWLKLGWAFNGAASQPAFEPGLDAHFPEIVLHGASRLNPSLRRYYGRLPRQRSHYGGYYTQTAENWPLIGPMAPAGSFVVGALSGFGTMAACAAGSLCAGWIAGAALPGYAAALSLARYQDQALMAELRAATDKGLL